nr:hypothetical protein K02F3.5 - Caenorhabditis elegans [Caenorhabditis elegans]
MTASLILLPVLLNILYQPAGSSLPTFSPGNKHLCEGFGFNWAAEIRCLRDIINDCEEGTQEKSRGGRSLQRSEFPTDNTPQADYGNPYSYPRPYSRTYHRNSISPIRPPVPMPIPQISQGCNCNHDIEALEAKFDKKLYEVKMHAQYETEKGVGDLRKQFETDLREYERITTKDIVEIKRHLDYLQAPRITNNDLEYFFIQREESWYTASEKCIGYGAHLASIHSRLELGFVQRLVPVNQTAWIGVNDIQKENVFRNSDGTPVDFYKWGKISARCTNEIALGKLVLEVLTATPITIQQYETKLFMELKQITKLFQIQQAETYCNYSGDSMNRVLFGPHRQQSPLTKLLTFKLSTAASMSNAPSAVPQMISRANQCCAALEKSRLSACAESQVEIFFRLSARAESREPHSTGVNLHRLSSALIEGLKQGCAANLPNMRRTANFKKVYLPNLPNWANFEICRTHHKLDFKNLTETIDFVQHASGIMSIFIKETYFILFTVSENSYL